MPVFSLRLFFSFLFFSFFFSIPHSSSREPHHPIPIAHFSSVQSFPSRLSALAFLSLSLSHTHTQRHIRTHTDTYAYHPFPRLPPPFALLFPSCLPPPLFLLLPKTSSGVRGVGSMLLFLSPRDRQWGFDISGYFFFFFFFFRGFQAGFDLGSATCSQLEYMSQHTMKIEETGLFYIHKAGAIDQALRNFSGFHRKFILDLSSSYLTIPFQDVGIVSQRVVSALLTSIVFACLLICISSPYLPSSRLLPLFTGASGLQQKWTNVALYFQVWSYSRYLVLSSYQTKNHLRG